VCLKIEKEAPETNQYCAWRSANTGRAANWFVERIINGKKNVSD
jgi:hypothetical protein